MSNVPRYAATSLICCDPPGDVVMAANYDALAADLAEAREILAAVVSRADYDRLLAEFDALTAERDRLVKDAERYRWLRGAGIKDFPATISDDWWNEVLGDSMNESFDAAIDAAMQEKREPWAYEDGAA